MALLCDVLSKNTLEQDDADDDDDDDHVTRSVKTHFCSTYDPD